MWPYFLYCALMEYPIRKNKLYKSTNTNYVDKMSLGK